MDEAKGRFQEQKVILELGGFRNNRIHRTGRARGGGTPYNGLNGEAPPERGTFFRLQVSERVGISRTEVYERVGTFRYLKGPLIKIFRVDNNIVFWLTSLPVILFSPNTNIHKLYSKGLEKGCSVLK